MNRKPRHVIQRQILELSSDRPDVLRRFEANAAELADRIMLPVIEDCFDKFASEEALLTIDRLKIDLGSFVPDRLQTEIAKRLEDALNEALLGCSGAGLPPLRSLPRSPPHFDVRRAPSSAGDDGEDFAARGASVGERRNILEMLCHYLSFGRLPWWSDAVTNVVEAFRALDHRDQVAPILAAIRRSPGAAIRSAKVLGDGMLGRLIEEAAPAVAALVRGVCAPGQSGDRGGKREQHRGLIRAVCLLRLGGHSVYPKRAAILEALEGVSAETLDKREALLAWIGTPARESTKCEVESETSNRSAATVESNHSIELPAKDREHGRNSSHLPPAKMGDRDGCLQHGRTPLREPARSRSTPATRDRPIADSVKAGEEWLDEGEPVYVGLAGIVMLHPFLEELFRARGLLEAKAFISAETRSTAVCLLGYLGAGSLGAPEFELLVPKLLCEQPWEEALPPWTWTPVDEAARDDCETLLQAVIDHWKALGKASPDGLRQAFLQREGRLDRRDDDWRLLVERKAQDILLDRLPWGFSTIRLPWMTSTLHVSWT